MTTAKTITTGLLLSYNGVCIQDANLLDFRISCRYSEHNQKQWEVITVHVEGTVINANDYLSSGGAGLDDPNSASRLHSIQVAIGAANPENDTVPTTLQMMTNRLMMPCQDLVMWLDDVSGSAKGSLGDSAASPTFDGSNARQIILAACGRVGVDPLVSSPKSTEGEYVGMVDPYVGLNATINSRVKRIDVMDCNRGPIPKDLSVIRFSPSVTRVRFMIEICRPLSGRAVTSLEGPSGPNSTGVDTDTTAEWELEKGDHLAFTEFICNEWSVTESMGNDGAITHRIAGQCVVSDVRYKPYAYRYFVFPMLFPFARVAARETVVSNDGRTIRYVYVHTHAGAAPPEGVRDFDAKYREVCSTQVKGMMNGSISVNVKGWYCRSDQNALTLVSEKTQKTLLLRQAITILVSRLRGVKFENAAERAAAKDKAVTLLDIEVIENVGKPELSLRATVMYGGDAGQMDFALRLANMGDPFFSGGAVAIPAYDPRWWPIDSIEARIRAMDAGHPAVDVFSWWQFESKHDYLDTKSPRRDGGRTSQLPLFPGSGEKEYASYKNPGTEQIADFVFLDGESASTPAASLKFDGPVRNPLYQPVAFNAIVSVAMDGTAMPATKPTNMPTSVGLSTFSNAQLSGKASYVSYSSEVLSTGDTGVVSMPLTKSRKLIPGGSPGENAAMATSAFVRLFSGSGHRVVSVSASRMNDWPKLPSPAEEIIKYSDPEGTIMASKERLVRKELLADEQEPLATGNGVVYRSHIRLTYASTVPWSPTAQQAGLTIDELFPVVFNPILQDDAATRNSTRIKASEQFDPALYS